MRCARIAVPVVAAVAAWSASVAVAEPLAVSARPVAVHAEDESVREVGALTYRGGLDLRSNDRRFGGLSALGVDPSGRRLLALTDKGYWIELTPTYNGNGDLAGIGEARIGALGDLETGSVAGTRRADAETVTRTPDGDVVGFESRHRLWLYPRTARTTFSRPKALRPPRDLNTAPVNEGIEALATLADGRLLALTEGLSAGDGHVRGWVAVGDDWRPLRYRLTGRFVPTGADTLPGGDVLVLERRFTWIGGLASRIVRVAGATIRPGATLDGMQVAIFDPPLTVENFEGIAVRPRTGGGAYVYLVSDDNFYPIQRTLLMMFEYRG